MSYKIPLAIWIFACCLSTLRAILYFSIDTVMISGLCMFSIYLIILIKKQDALVSNPEEVKKC